MASFLNDEFSAPAVPMDHFNLTPPTEDSPTIEDDFFLVKGDMDLRPYLISGFVAPKKTDYRICYFNNGRKDNASLLPADEFLEIDKSRAAPPAGMAGRKPNKMRERGTTTKTRSDRNKPAADVVVAQKKIASAPMSRYEKQKLKQRKQDRNQHWGSARPKIHYEWSIKPDPQWNNLRQINLNELARSELDQTKVKVTEVASRGVIPFFDKSFEKVSPKSPKMVKKSGIVHHNAGFFEDEFLATGVDDSSVQVIATDEVLTQLMSACLTRYSWHLKVYKEDGKVIIDKEDGTITEKMTVRETSRTNVPVTDDPVLINRPKELHDEATNLQADIAQMLISSDAKKFEDPEFSFKDPKHENQGRKMYKYRKFSLPPTSSSKNHDDITIMTRVEIDAVRLVDGKPHYTIVKAMNEYDNKGGSYRQQLDKQPGALSAAEYRNNSPKMARWISQAMLAGADTLALGWVTRDQPHSNLKHQLLGVMTEKMELLQNQLGLKPKNVWGILRSLIDQFTDASLPDGEYVVLREPSKPTIRIMFIGENEEEESEQESE